MCACALGDLPSLNLSDYSSGKLEFTRAKLHAQAEGSGDQKLRFAVYECLTKLDGECFSDTPSMYFISPP